MSRAVVISAVRTPIGRYGGALSGVRPDDLAGLAIAAAVDRAGVDPELRRRDGRIGLATLCVGVGQGQAALFERPAA